MSDQLPSRATVSPSAARNRHLILEVLKPRLPPTGFVLEIAANVGSRAEERLDGATFVHGPVALGDLIQREGEVQDLPGVDGAVPDELDELGEEPAHRCRTAVQVGMAEKQLVAGQVAVGDTDIADVPTRPVRPTRWT